MPRTRDLSSCPECGEMISKDSEDCPSCGAVLTLRRRRFVNPHQTLLDLNKFFIVAAIFIVLIIPLGYCVRPG